MMRSRVFAIFSSTSAYGIRGRVVPLVVVPLSVSGAVQSSHSAREGHEKALRHQIGRQESAYFLQPMVRYERHVVRTVTGRFTGDASHRT
jgi:hypothetical protein